jgi:hypothetical protein
MAVSFKGAHLRPMLGFKAFDAAQGTLAGVELMHIHDQEEADGT